MVRIRFGAVCLLLAVLTACGTPTDNYTASTSGTRPAATAARSAATSGAAAVGAQPATTGKQYPSAPPMQIDPNKSYTAVIDTNKGKMTAELYAKDAPITVNNFVFLAKDGFYRNVKFHRIIKGFMVQTGDPQGTGRGGPGYTFKDEPVTRAYTKGTLAMANAGPNTNGSQFFIVHGDTGLPKNYTIFGKLTDGLNVLDTIANTPVTAGDSGESSKPSEDVHINDVTVVEK